MTVAFFVSTAHDGTMKSPDLDYHPVLEARRTFLRRHDIDETATTLVQTTYGGDDYCRYFTSDDSQKGDGIIRGTSVNADGLVVTNPGHALFLPLADCIGVVIHDPTQNILMLSHLGRHNLEQSGGMHSIEYMVRVHGSDPTKLTIWLSPAAGQMFYPLHAFGNRSLHDVATEQLIDAGVLAQNITVSPIDSAANPAYYSHSQFLQGNRSTDGRHAVVAVLR